MFSVNSKTARERVKASETVGKRSFFLLAASVRVSDERVVIRSISTIATRLNELLLHDARLRAALSMAGLRLLVSLKRLNLVLLAFGEAFRRFLFHSVASGGSTEGWQSLQDNASITASGVQDLLPCTATKGNAWRPGCRKFFFISNFVGLLAGDAG